MFGSRVDFVLCVCEHKSVLSIEKALCLRTCLWCRKIVFGLVSVNTNVFVRQCVALCACEHRCICGRKRLCLSEHKFIFRQRASLCVCEHRCLVSRKALFVLYVCENRFFVRQNVFSFCASVSIGVFLVRAGIVCRG